MHQPAHHVAFYDAPFLRTVVDQLRVRPDQRQAAGQNGRQRLAGADAARIIGAVGLDLLAMFGERYAIGGQSLVRSRAISQRTGRNRHRVVPELVERRRQFLDDRPRGKHIVVRHLGIRVDLEILVADIASADQRDRVVDDDQFVVHPVVEARIVEREFEHAQERGMTAITERVEYSNFNLPMSVQRHQLLIALNRFAVVDQHAHAHAAVGRPQHGLGQQLAGFVRAENKVLQIEGALGGIDHLDPRQIAVDTYRQQAEPGIAGVFARRVGILPAEARLLRLFERRRRRSWENRNRAAATRIRRGTRRQE